MSNRGTSQLHGCPHLPRRPLHPPLPPNQVLVSTLRTGLSRSPCARSPAREQHPWPCHRPSPELRHQRVAARPPSSMQSSRHLASHLENLPREEPHLPPAAVSSTRIVPAGAPAVAWPFCPCPAALGAHGSHPPTSEGLLRFPVAPLRIGQDRIRLHAGLQLFCSICATNACHLHLQAWTLLPWSFAELFHTSPAIPKSVFSPAANAWLGQCSLPRG
mmetsp:Transcript_39359/g.84794  ORF Transcript_39359/g.84794 Transcript_39359/m.84794 type:complete len:217 (+) Transcript_39359:1010-1660(+)